VTEQGSLASMAEQARHNLGLVLVYQAGAQIEGFTRFLRAGCALASGQRLGALY
jgi:hypothetical protein